MKTYIYCTQTKPYLISMGKDTKGVEMFQIIFDKKDWSKDEKYLNGSIVAELNAIRDRGFIRLVDALGVHKDDEGAIWSVEVSDLSDDEAISRPMWSIRALVNSVQPVPLTPLASTISLPLPTAPSSVWASFSFLPAKTLTARRNRHLKTSLVTGWLNSISAKRARTLSEAVSTPEIGVSGRI